MCVGQGAAARVVRNTALLVNAFSEHRHDEVVAPGAQATSADATEQTWLQVRTRRSFASLGFALVSWYTGWKRIGCGSNVAAAGPPESWSSSLRLPVPGSCLVASSLLRMLSLVGRLSAAFAACMLGIIRMLEGESARPGA
jgi:hypothetical protein